MWLLSLMGKFPAQRRIQDLQDQDEEVLQKWAIESVPTGYPRHGPLTEGFAVQFPDAGLWLVRGRLKYSG